MKPVECAETAVLIRESRAHLFRIATLLESARHQTGLARDLMRESRRYLELIEKVEAARIMSDRDS